MTAQIDGSTATDPLPEALRHVPRLLGAEFGDEVKVELVERTVAETYHELAADARVSSFLPILTEKVARDRLLDITPRRGRHREAQLSA